MIYLLYSFEAIEADNPVASDDKTSVLGMFDAWIRQPVYNWLDDEDLQRMKARLEKLLADNRPGDYDLLDGVSGPIFKIVRKWRANFTSHDESQP